MSAIELPVLRYKYDWRQDGEEESLVIPLYDCTAEACNQCADGETALLVEALDWAVVCQELPFSVSMVDQRSIGSDNDNSDEETGPLIQESIGELTGALASSSSTAVLAGLQAQNKAYAPEEAEEGGPTGRSLTGSVSTTAASTTPAQTTVVPTTVAPTTILPDPKSQEADSGTEAPAAAPTTTTTTEAPVEATEPTVVAAAIEPADEEKAEASESNEATTEASATASSTTEAADIEDEPESDVGLQDDEYTLKAKEDKSSEDDQTEEEDHAQDSDEKEDSEQDSDEESLFEDKESRAEEDDSEESDQIHLQTGIKSDEAASWRAKYFTILGFFICFFIAFVIIIVFIIMMKKKRAAPPTMIGATTGNVSPGPALERS